MIKSLYSRQNSWESRVLSPVVSCVGEFGLYCVSLYYCYFNCCHCDCCYYFVSCPSPSLPLSLSPSPSLPLSLSPSLPLHLSLSPSLPLSLSASHPLSLTLSPSHPLTSHHVTGEDKKNPHGNYQVDRPEALIKQVTRKEKRRRKSAQKLPSCSP